MLRLADNYFLISKENDGFAVLERAVQLFENFFSLENGTVLTYGFSKLDRLSAVTEKEVFYQITEFSGMITKSMMMNLTYQTPIGPVNEEAIYGYDMEGFKRSMVFSDHIDSVLKNAGWDGFACVKDDPRYTALRERVKTVSDIESIGNLMFLMDTQRNRTDDYVKGKKWFCALLVKDAGAYMIFDDAGDIEEKYSWMQREDNTLVYRIAAVESGGGFIEPPEIIRKRLLELNENNKNAEIVIRDNSGEILYTKI